MVRGARLVLRNLLLNGRTPDHHHQGKNNVTVTPNAAAALIVAQRIHEGRSLSGFIPQEIAAGTALHEHQEQVRAAYQRVLDEADCPPLPPINAKVRRILEAAAQAELDSRDILDAMP